MADKTIIVNVHEGEKKRQSMWPALLLAGVFLALLYAGYGTVVIMAVVAFLLIRWMLNG